MPYEVISAATHLGLNYGCVTFTTLSQYEKEVWNPKKVFKYKDLYGSIRGAKTYSSNQIRYSENTESHSDLKPLTQYEETHQVNLQVPDISSSGYPVDVPPMIYILFVFAVA
jgi:hypothetical protein